LDETSIEVKNEGIENLEDLIIFSQLFCPKIENISIFNKDVKTSFSKKIMENIDSIAKYEIYSSTNDIENQKYYVYINTKDDFETCLITACDKQNKHEYLLPVSKNIPKLFFTFPLIGTEKLGIPFIINSNHFNIAEERDKVYLKSDHPENLVIMKEALETCLPKYLEICSKLGIKRIYELYKILIPDYDWIDEKWYQEMLVSVVSSISEIKAINIYNRNDLYSLQDLNIPYSQNKSALNSLWHLFSNINTMDIPIETEISEWNNVLEVYKNIYDKDNIFEFKYCWGINDLIHSFIKNYENVSSIKDKYECDTYSWFNDFYKYLIAEQGNLPNEKILISQDGIFINTKGSLWDGCNDDILINISNKIGLNYSSSLIDRNINKFSSDLIDTLSFQDSIEKIYNAINKFESKDLQNDLELQSNNAIFLKWLINHNKLDYIKEYKIIRNYGDDIIYENLLEGKDLLFYPKICFLDTFKNYLILIGEKYFVSEVYSKYLTIDDFNCLARENFILTNPLIHVSVEAKLKDLEILEIDKDSRKEMIDDKGALQHKFIIEYTDYAYFSAKDGYIFDNMSEKKALNILKFLFTDAIDNDSNFKNDHQEIIINGTSIPIILKKCYWLYHAKRLNWVPEDKIEEEEIKPSFQAPSSKNIADLIKDKNEIKELFQKPEIVDLINKLGLGVSDIIRNSLDDDDKKLNMDRMATVLFNNIDNANLTPEVFDAILKTPKLKEEIEKQQARSAQIRKNQDIGTTVELLFRTYIEGLAKSGKNISIRREPHGSDYVIYEDDVEDLLKESENILEEEIFNIKDEKSEWFLELKSTKTKSVTMSDLQAKTAKSNKENYALIVVEIDDEQGINEDYIKNKMMVYDDVGIKLETLVADYNDVQNLADDLEHEVNGVSVNFNDKSAKFRIKYNSWGKGITIEEFLNRHF
jgi:hypothetical protein